MRSAATHPSQLSRHASTTHKGEETNRRTHILAPDLYPALLQALLDVVLLIALVVPQPADEVVEGLFEPAQSRPSQPPLFSLGPSSEPTRRSAASMRARPWARSGRVGFVHGAGVVPRVGLAQLSSVSCVFGSGSSV